LVIITFALALSGILFYSVSRKKINTHP
jgi:hypothetical protein